MRILPFPTIGIIAVAAWSMACESPLRVCNLNLVYGLSVAVTDSVSGTPLMGLETIVEIRDGTYVDTLEQMTATEYFGAAERVGTYAVKVERSGYRVWLSNGIRVREDECHVIPVQLNARLQAE